MTSRIDRRSFLSATALAAAMMLSAGVKKTLVAGGRSDNAIVTRKGSGAELSSSIENNAVSLILAAPGVTHFKFARR